MCFPVPPAEHTWLRIAVYAVHPLASFCLYTCERNDPSLSRRHMFCQRPGVVIEDLCGLTTKLAGIVLLVISCWFRLLLVLGSLRPSLMHSEGSVSSICWACPSISSLFAACSNNCWSVYLFTIASRRSFSSDFSSDDVIRIRETTLCDLKP